MSKGAKKTITLLGLVLVLGGIIAAYMLVPKKDNKKQEVKKENIGVANILTDGIRLVKIDAGENKMELVKDGDSWKIMEKPSAPVDREEVDKFLKGFEAIRATKEIKMDSVGLGEYGLEKDYKTIEIVDETGKKYEFKLGADVPVEGGMYGTFNDVKLVYAFNEEFSNKLKTTMNSIIKKDVIENVGEEYLTGVKINLKGTDIFEAKVVEPKDQVDLYNDWNIVKPYAKPLSGTNTEDWTTLRKLYSSLKFDELIEYDAKDLKKYGLDKPDACVDVDYIEAKKGYKADDDEPTTTALPQNQLSSGRTNEGMRIISKANVIPKKFQKAKSYKFLVGKKTSDGSYYVKLGSNNNIYKLSAEMVDGMVNVDAYTYMDPCVYAVLINDIKGYEVEIGKTKIKVDRVEEKNDAGKKVDRWVINGKKIDDSKENEVLTPYSKAYLLTFTSKVDPKVDPKAKKPVMKITYHQKLNDVVVKYLPYDGTNFYKIDKNGMDYFLVDKNSADAAMNAFKGLLKL
ncbi:DUF4340 domain-containing protein [Eubacterium xylanophilum]|uniref:DUF4340 domain-containing protein n=1 Tax=Eubacterium xylanophilum TaxID=39497 RepID=UPI000479E7B5|nr:DUF4340 domain-containing protein [Eubacterium xylanophilum]